LGKKVNPKKLKVSPRTVTSSIELFFMVCQPQEERLQRERAQSPS
jgi:hypothetical protein